MNLLTRRVTVNQARGEKHKEKPIRVYQWENYSTRHIKSTDFEYLIRELDDMTQRNYAWYPPKYCAEDDVGFTDHRQNYQTGTIKRVTTTYYAGYADHRYTIDVDGWKHDIHVQEGHIVELFA